MLGMCIYYFNLIIFVRFVIIYVWIFFFRGWVFKNFENKMIYFYYLIRGKYREILKNCFVLNWIVDCLREKGKYIVYEF